MTTYLVEFDAKRKDLVQKLAGQLGYSLEPLDIELFAPATNHVRIRSIRGVFFVGGRAQSSPWGRKEDLPKNFKMPKQGDQFKVDEYFVDFDDGFFKS